MKIKEKKRQSFHQNSREVRVFISPKYNLSLGKKIFLVHAETYCNKINWFALTM